MSIVKKISISWKAMTPTQKIKFIVESIASIGTGIMASDIGMKLGEGHKLPGKVCIMLATTGLGMAAGEVAGKAFCEEIDIIDEFVQKRKEEKANND